jgi:hypothetical protein
MQKTLNFCDQITDVNPSSQLIEQRLRELDTSKNDGCLIYEDAARCFVQTQGDEEIGFLVEYHNADNSIALQTTERLNFQDTLLIFLKFTSSDISWIDEHETYDL